MAPAESSHVDLQACCCWVNEKRRDTPRKRICLPPVDMLHENLLAFGDISLDFQVQAVIHMAGHLRLTVSPEKLTQESHPSHPGHLRHLSTAVSLHFIMPVCLPFHQAKVVFWHQARNGQPLASGCSFLISFRISWLELALTISLVPLGSNLTFLPQGGYYTFVALAYPWLWTQQRKKRRKWLLRVKYICTYICICILEYIVLRQEQGKCNGKKLPNVDRDWPEFSFSQLFSTLPQNVI